MESINLENIKYCCLCESEVRSFLPYNDQPNVFTNELEVIGSDVENFYCPKCKCFDRERHLWLYMNAIGLFDLINDKKILCVAPEERLIPKLFEKTKNITVVDYCPERYSKRPYDVLKLDIRDINYDNETFDMVLANHVLEHVDDYKKALNEIFRVLKYEGIAILQTPYSPVIKNNFEDPAINTDELREKYYGEKDHFRIFGLTFWGDLENIGFRVNLLWHKDVLQQFDATKYGVNVREPFMFVQKHKTI